MKRIISLIVCILLVFSVTPVMADETVYYTVDFYVFETMEPDNLGWSLKLYSSVQVAEGDSATPPDISGLPAPPGYVFSGIWFGGTLSNIRSDLRIFADYNKSANPTPFPTPTTAAPTTQATTAPTTAAPTTAAPTTVAPTTVAPTTKAATETTPPTTVAPTTKTTTETTPPILSTDVTDSTETLPVNTEEETVPETTESIVSAEATETEATPSETSESVNPEDSDREAGLDSKIFIGIGVVVLIAGGIGFFLLKRHKDQEP